MGMGSWHWSLSYSPFFTAAATAASIALICAYAQSSCHPHVVMPCNLERPKGVIGKLRFKEQCFHLALLPTVSKPHSNILGQWHGMASNQQAEGKVCRGFSSGPRKKAMLQWQPRARS
eukprot:1156198-Pelagomonas_calceolata.AAC.4